MLKTHSILVILAVVGAAAQGKDQSPDQPAAPGGDPQRPAASIDSGGIGCGSAHAALTREDVLSLLKGGVSSAVILDVAKARGHDSFSSRDLAEFKNAQAADDLLTGLAKGPEMYIGWSVLPSSVIRDNYGHYVMNKFFAVDVAVSNRSTDKSVVIAALEFCHEELRDVSTDPTLVRGSLQKGELTGRRSIASNTIQGLGSVMSPSAPFFKVAAHRATFSTGAALFSPLKSAFDLIVPDTIAVYLTN